MAAKRGPMLDATLLSILVQELCVHKNGPDVGIPF